MTHWLEQRQRRSFGAAAAIVAVLAIGLLPGGPAVRDARAATSVNLDQWATLDRAWQNGNLNGNNTRYPEGGLVPFRLAVEGLTAGSHTIRIQYDFTAGGHKAYDFLGRYDGWVKPPICDGSGGGISSMCPSMPTPHYGAFPSDGFKADGLTVRDAEAYSGVIRRLTIWGGTISSIAGPTHAGSTDGNSTAEFTVRFRSTGSAVLLAWGGHLAQSRFWNMATGGPRDGAGEVSGAPWHMRTLQLDGSGNRNQDRSIQPSAIVGELPPRALAAPTPTPRRTPVAVPRAVVPPPPPGTGPVPPPPPGTGPGSPPTPTGPPTSIDGPNDPAGPGVRWDVLVLLVLAVVVAAVAHRRRQGWAKRAGP